MDRSAIQRADRGAISDNARRKPRVRRLLLHGVIELAFDSSKEPIRTPSDASETRPMLGYSDRFQNNRRLQAESAVKLTQLWPAADVAWVVDDHAGPVHQIENQPLIDGVPVLACTDMRENSI